MTNDEGSTKIRMSKKQCRDVSSFKSFVIPFVIRISSLSHLLCANLHGSRVNLALCNTISLPCDKGDPIRRARFRPGVRWTRWSSPGSRQLAMPVQQFSWPQQSGQSQRMPPPGYVEQLHD